MFARTVREDVSRGPGMTKKNCPFEDCNHRQEVPFNTAIDTSPSSRICPKCNQKYDIITMLGGSRKAGKAGGFKIVKPFKPKVDTTEILNYISKSKGVHAVKIAMKFNRPPTTIRGYLAKMENDGLVMRTVRGNSKIVHITEYGAQVLA